VTQFVVKPFSAVDISEIVELIGNLFQADIGEIQTTNIQSDVMLQSNSSEKNLRKLVDGAKHHSVQGTALRINSCFETN
jgi:hypothetical protein